MSRENPHWNSGWDCCNPAQDACFGAVQVNDVRAQAPEESCELDDSKGVVDRRESSSHLPQREEGDVDARGRRLEGSISVGCYGDLESLVASRVDQLANVRLRAADLGKRDDEEDERSRAVDARRVVEPSPRLGLPAVNATAIANARQGAGR